MAFHGDLMEALELRDRDCAGEFSAGDSLETVLGRHLLAVERAADTDLLTSVLLLDEEGERLLHGAAPSLPKAYCDAIHGIRIGPNVGSCGTVAYLGHSIYVIDIATDPLWTDFRDLALAHGLRACWSTPIEDEKGHLIGTFAIYHRTPRSPTEAEKNAIRMISGHVAAAISSARASR